MAFVGRELEILQPASCLTAEPRMMNHDDNDDNDDDVSNSFHFRCDGVRKCYNSQILPTTIKLCALRPSITENNPMNQSEINVHVNTGRTQGQF